MQSIDTTGAEIPVDTTATVDNLELVENVPAGTSPVISVNLEQRIQFDAPPNNFYIHVNIRLRVTNPQVITGTDNRVVLDSNSSTNWIGFPQEFVIPELGVEDEDTFTTVYGFITPTSGATDTITFRLANECAHDLLIVGVAIYGWRNLTV